jgi:hypothetical protein
MSDWEFIAAEFIGAEGEEGERIIWEAIIKALRGTGEGIAILNYTDFNHDGQSRYQPDILLLECCTLAGVKDSTSPSRIGG